MNNYNLTWIDERLLDNDKRKIKEYWKSLNKDIIFNGDELNIYIKAEDNIEAIIKTLKLINDLNLEIYSLIKSEVILTEEIF